MSSLNDLFENHSICKFQRKLRKDFVLNKFKEFIDEDSFNDWHYSLYPFAEKRPLKYFDESVIKYLTQFLIKHDVHFLESIVELTYEITNGIFSTVREGSSWNLEHSLLLNSPSDIIEFERVWHPEYQRYCEHIFNNLIKVPLSILSKMKAKDYLRLTLTNQINILNDNDLEYLTTGFNSTVRNAISHGSVNFQLMDIEYVDRKKTETLFPMQFAKLFDSLVDISHSIVISLILVLGEKDSKIKRRGIDQLAVSLQYLYFDGINSHPGYKIQHMVQSETIKSQHQLNLSCRLSSPVRLTHQFESLYTAWLIQTKSISGYERFAFSIDCGKEIKASIYFDGIALQQCINQNLPLEKSSDVIETSMLWFDAPAWKRKRYIWSNVISIGKQVAKRDIISNWEKSNLHFARYRYFFKKIENKSSDKIHRVDAICILKPSYFFDLDIMLKIIRQVVRRMRRRLISTKDFDGESWMKRRPQYIWLRIFLNDKRERELIKNSGFPSDNLVVKAEWISRKYRNNPIFVKNPNMLHNKIRLHFNPIFDTSENS